MPAPAPRRLLRPRDPPPALRPGLRLLRRRRRPDRRSGGAAAHRRARDPARLGRRVDLPLSARAPAGDRHRRRRAQAVPLPRRLARAARHREVRDDGALRARAAAAARARRGRPRRLRPARPAVRAGARGAAARARLLPHRLGGVRGRQRVLRPRDAAQGARPGRGRRRDGLRLPGQERPAAAARASRTSAPPSWWRRSSGGAAAIPSCSPTRSAGAGATCAPRTSTLYLKEATGSDFSAKDFRTWNATMLAAVALARVGRGRGQPDRRASARSTARSTRSRATSATRRPSAAPPTSTRACSTPTGRGSRSAPRSSGWRRGWSRASSPIHQPALERAVLDLLDEREESRAVERVAA